MALSSKPYFYRNNPTDKVWWVDFGESVGDMAVSFDKKNILYLFQDYPWNFTDAQKALFDQENPYWAKFFSDRPRKR